MFGLCRLFDANYCIVQHIVVNKDCPQRTIYYSSTVLQCKVNLIEKSIFRVPHFENPEQKHVCHPFANDPLLKSHNICLGDNLMRYCLAPVKTIGFEKPNAENTIPSVDISKIQGDIMLQEVELGRLLDKYREQVALIEKQVDPIHDSLGASEAEIVFLGTGGSLPSKYRNGKN